jgi:alkylhydroperoxidase/carboxymuconolactone decarboxylase family protein YurZ
VLSSNPSAIERCDAAKGVHHARAAARAGATRQDVAEALGVAVQMGGGPVLNYGAEALGAFDEFSAASPGAG